MGTQEEGRMKTGTEAGKEPRGVKDSLTGDLHSGRVVATVVENGNLGEEISF